MVELGEWIPLLESVRLPKAAGIYIVRNVASGLEYVGQSTNIRKRMTAHRGMRSAFYFHRALRKHGLTSFEVCVWSLGSPEDLGEREIALIAERRTFAPAGYNASLGGLGPRGTVWTEEARERARERGRRGMTDEMKKKLKAARPEVNGWKGKKHTEEARRLMGEASSRLKKGTTYGPEIRARMKAAQQNRQPVTATTRLKMGASQAARFAAEQHISSREVAVWLPGSMLPLIFPSTLEAFKWTGIKSRTSIRNWCEGRQVPNNGWAWTFL